MNKAILVTEQLTKTYHDGKLNVPVLHEINLNVKAGERIAIVGQSGAGKSTLLHLLGGLDHASGGQVIIDGQDIFALSETQRCQLRNEKLGFIYQFHHLLPEFSALENAAMPLLIRGWKIKQAKQKAAELLDKIGLSKRLDHKPAQLSGGERQRVAVARALVGDPLCVLADEPTGNLDHDTAAQVYDIMLELNQHLKTSFIIVTHELTLAKQMDKVYELRAGQLYWLEAGSN